MKDGRRVLLINPTITSKAHARFPLAILSLAAALEGRRPWSILDGNIDRDFVATATRTVADDTVGAVGVTVMGGPQLRSAIAVSMAVRESRPEIPIVWGGAFPTCCPDATLNTTYVDFAVRSQGEQTLIELLAAIDAGAPEPMLAAIPGLSWRRGDAVEHNSERAFSAASLQHRLPYELLPNPRQYLPSTYLGRRTAGYQAALGCRYRCTFCGVATMYGGKTALPPALRLEQDLDYLTNELGVDGIQFYDHNFFDRDEEMVPLLEVMAKFQLPWWCFARSDALVNMPESTWKLVRKSRLRMAYIGAESPSDWLLHDIRKGTRSDQTLEAIALCRAHGVIPELSFMLAPPQDPEGETEKTFEFIRLIKRQHPDTEVMIYLYTPLPKRTEALSAGSSTAAAAAASNNSLRDRNGQPVEFPRTADGWAQSEWVEYWCHKNAPWVTPRLRRRIVDFTTVLGCRFPTIMDIHAPAFGKKALRALASWRYRFQRYGNPWELRASRKVIGHWDPRVMSL